MDKLDRLESVSKEYQFYHQAVSHDTVVVNNDPGGPMVISCGVEQWEYIDAMFPEDVTALRTVVSKDANSVAVICSDRVIVYVQLGDNKWSLTHSFIYEDIYPYSPDKTVGFNVNVAWGGNNNILAIASHSFKEVGRLSVYSLSNSGTYHELDIVDPDYDGDGESKITDCKFGMSMDFSTDGQLLAVGAPSTSENGRIFIYSVLKVVKPQGIISIIYGTMLGSMLQWQPDSANLIVSTTKSNSMYICSRGARESAGPWSRYDIISEPTDLPPKVQWAMAANIVLCEDGFYALFTAISTLSNGGSFKLYRYVFEKENTPGHYIHIGNYAASSVLYYYPTSRNASMTRSLDNKMLNVVMDGKEISNRVAISIRLPVK